MAGTAIEITDSNFEEIIKSDKPVLVDFWAVWCGPCKMIAPIIEELAIDFNESAIIGKCDVDNNSVVASKFGIRSIPTLMIFQNGVMVDKIVGAAPKHTIQQKLQSYID